MKPNVAAIIALSVIACTPAQRRAAYTALDVASTACVLVRGALEDGTIRTVCASPEVLIPLAKSIIESQCVVERDINKL